jgi:hypothetical protein
LSYKKGKKKKAIEARGEEPAEDGDKEGKGEKTRGE